jgi:hypothetical protein
MALAWANNFSWNDIITNPWIVLGSVALGALFLWSWATRNPRV